MKRVVAMALVAICAAQAAFARDTVYDCTFKPGPRDYWIPSTLTITDPGPGARPMVWDEMIEKAVGRPVVAEVKINKSRQSYAWEIGPVDVSSIPGGTGVRVSEIYYTLVFLPGSKVVLRAYLGSMRNYTPHLFGSCTMQQ
jgi:hypothetical protein